MSRTARDMSRNDEVAFPSHRYVDAAQVGNGRINPIFLNKRGIQP